MRQTSTIAARQINENKVRFIAFWVLLSTLLYLLFPVISFPLLLSADFALRAFDLGTYSPFALSSDQAIRIFGLGQKLIFYPPKRFAARVGLVLSFLILGLHIWGAGAQYLSIVLAFFAALESIGGICVGCYIYNWLVKIKILKTI
jgi:hypothetical protein